MTTYIKTITATLLAAALVAGAIVSFAPSFAKAQETPVDETVTTDTVTDTPAEPVLEEPAPVVEEVAPEEVVTEETVVEEPAPIEEEAIPTDPTPEVLGATTDPAPASVISSEKDDYHPGDLATLFGNFFAPLTDFVVKVFGSDENDQNYTETDIAVTSDENGSFTTQYQLDSLYRPFYEVAVFLGAENIAETWFRDSSVGAYDQCSNDLGTGYTSGNLGCRWTNGNLNAQNSTYFEGDSTVQRMWIEGYAPGSSHTITFKYGTTKAGKHAYDYLTTWNASENWVTVADRCEGITGCDTAPETQSAMKNDPNVTDDTIEPAAAGRLFTIRGGIITNVSTPAIDSGTYGGDSETVVTITFTVANSGSMCTTKGQVTSCGVAVWFGGHVAKTSEWNAFNGTTGAGFISGSPYHVALSAEDGASIGNRDNQMQSNALPSQIIVHKVTDPVSDPQQFTFTKTGNGNGYTSPHNLVGGGTNSQIVTPKNNQNTYTITEGAVAQWNLADISCTSNNEASTVSVNTGTRSFTTVLDLNSSTVIDCTFTNVKQQNGTIIVDKVTVPAADPQSFNFDAVGGSYQDFALTDAAQPNSQSLVAGNYSVSETVPAGWDQTSATCVSSIGDTETIGNLELDAGETITCTFTNTKRAHLIVDKVTVPSGDTQSFDFTTDAGSNFSLTDAAAPHDSGAVVPGTYSVAETVPSGWTQTSATCSDGSPIGAVNLSAGETVTCTFTNTKKGHITIEKQTLPDGDPATFGFTGDVSGTLGDGQTATVEVVPGTYSSVEGTKTGWDLTNIVCDDSDSTGDTGTRTATFHVAAGENVKCTFLNTKRGSLTVVKNTVGGNGTFNFTLGNINPAALQLITVGGTNSATFNNLVPGTFSAAETVPGGWDLTSATCDDGSDPASIGISAGEHVTCTFTNTKKPTLKLMKTVVNDNGGTAVAPDFQGKIDGGNVSWNVVQEVTVGGHTASETTLPTYTASSWGGDCAADGSVTLAAGENKVCTITNNDKPAHLNLVKHVVNDNGGTAVAGEWTLSAGANDVTGSEAGVQATDQAGTYDLSESSVGHYTNTSITCDDNPGVEVTSVTIGLGETKTCTFVNDDDAPSLILKKHVINDNGGTAEASDWTLSAGANDMTGSEAGVQVTDQAGTYNLSESGPDHYSNTSVTCDNGDGPDSVTLDLGETVTCTFVNDDDAPVLHLRKVVINDNGGTATVADFPLSADGAGSNDLSGTSPVDSNGTLQADTFALSETGVQGYTASDWVCEGGEQNGASITLGIGEEATCTITNDDQPGHLKIVKNTVGGDDTFDFDVTGPTPSSPEVVTASGTGDTGLIEVNAGNYSVSEQALAGWDLTGSSCDSGTPDAFTVPNGGTVVCTFENTKRGHITIEKQTLPDGSPFTFLFSGDVSGTLADGDTVTEEVAPGTYTSSETATDGWDLTDITCSDSDSSGDTGTGTATFEVAPGEDVTCVFTNTQRGHIILEKQTLPDGDTTSFDFDMDFGDGDADLADGQTDDTEVVPGTYSASENTPAGWDLTSATCDDGSEVDAIDVAPGETVTCTFTNTKRGHLIVDKVTNPSGDPQSFDFTAGGTGYSNFSLTDEAAPNDQEVVPGTYSVNETVPAGWDQTSATCDDGSDIGSIDVTPGETVTCTFENTKRAKLTIVKDAQPNDCQDFAFSGTLGAFSLDDDEGVADCADTNQPSSKTFENLVPGAQTVTETEPNSFWLLQGATCVNTADQSAHASSLNGGGLAVSLGAGEDVTCTFVNKKLGPTRTQGFWQTHLGYTKNTFNSPANTYSWFNAGNITVGDGITHQDPVNTIGKVFGGFWSNIANKSTGKGKVAQRTDLDKARMQLAQQLLAAQLNCAAFGCPTSIQNLITQANAHYATGTAAQILADMSALDAYNNSGDTITIGAPGKADPKGAKAVADYLFWDNP